MQSLFVLLPLHCRIQTLQAANEELAKVSDFLGISGPQETASQQFGSLTGLKTQPAVAHPNSATPAPAVQGSHGRSGVSEQTQRDQAPEPRPRPKLKLVKSPF